MSTVVFASLESLRSRFQRFPLRPIPFSYILSGDLIHYPSVIRFTTSVHVIVLYSFPDCTEFYLFLLMLHALLAQLWSFQKTCVNFFSHTIRILAPVDYFQIEFVLLVCKS